MKIRPTNTVKIKVLPKNYIEVMKHLQNSGVKYYPIRRVWANNYLIEVENYPIATFLLLKYGIH